MLTIHGTCICAWLTDCSGVVALGVTVLHDNHKSWGHTVWCTWRVCAVISSITVQPNKTTTLYQYVAIVSAFVMALIASAYSTLICCSQLFFLCSAHDNLPYIGCYSFRYLYVLNPCQYVVFFCFLPAWKATTGIAEVHMFSYTCWHVHNM